MITSANALLDDRAWLRAALETLKQTAPESGEVRINGQVITYTPERSFVIRSLTPQAESYFINMFGWDAEGVLDAVLQ